MPKSAPIRQTTAQERALLLARMRREAVYMGLFTLACAAGVVGFGYGFATSLGDPGLMALTGLMTLVLVFVTGLVGATVRNSLRMADQLPERLPVRVLYGKLRMGQRPPRTIDHDPFYLVGRWPRGALGWERVRAEGCHVPPPDGAGDEGPFVAFLLEELLPDDPVLR